MSIFNKFPSFTHIFKNAKTTFIRFPFASLASILATIFALILSEYKNPEPEYFLQKLLLFSLIGIPLFIALQVFSEKNNWKNIKAAQFQFVGIVFLIIYFFLTPDNFFLVDKFMIQYALFFTFCLFLNAYIPYLKGKSVQGFWQYNNALFLNFLVSVLYSHVLGAGLMIALAAMDHLFHMDIDPKRYMQIWIIISIFFNATVFMSKLPSDLDSLENDTSYPKGLKMFIQYILLPLVGLYLLILYTYEAKIIIQWNWPVGWVSNLVLWYSVVSIFSLLLLYPLRDKKENRWIQIFSNWFFRALIPLVIMLFFAIYERISEYGFTEPRYLVFVMAIGLVIVVLYYIFSKSKDIRIIPIIISVLAIISAFTASTISLGSQQSRLDKLLIENNLFLDGKLVTSHDRLDFDSRKNMSSISNYLLTTHGIESFEQWVEDSVLEAYRLKQEDKYTSKDVYTGTNDITELCSLLGFAYVSRWASSKYGEHFYFTFNDSLPIDISGYDYLFELNSNTARTDTTNGDCWMMIEKELPTQKLIQIANDSASIMINIKDSLNIIDEFGAIQLNDTLQSLYKLHNPNLLKSTELSYELIGELYDIKLIFKYINGTANDSITLSSFNGVLLLRIK